VRLIGDVKQGLLGPVPDGQAPSGKLDTGRYEEIFSNINRLVDAGCLPSKGKGATFPGLSYNDAYDTFMRGNAAFCIDVSQNILQYQYKKSLNPDMFDLGTFWVPPMGVTATDDPDGAFSVTEPDGTVDKYDLTVNPDSAIAGTGDINIRSLGGPTGSLSVFNKSQAQNDRAMNFLMWYYSKKGQDYRNNLMLSSTKAFPQGLSLVKGVVLPDIWQNAFAELDMRGDCQNSPFKETILQTVRGSSAGKIAFGMNFNNYLAGTYTMNDLKTNNQIAINQNINDWLAINNYRPNCFDTPNLDPRQ